MNDLAQAVVRGADVTWYYNCISSPVHRLRDRNQATGTIKYQTQVWLTKIITHVKSATYIEWIDDIYIDDIRSSWLYSVPAEKWGSEGNLYQDF